MASYYSRKRNFYNEKDEMGSHYSLVRLRNESTEDFEDRVRYQCRSEVGVDIESITSFMNNSIGYPEEIKLKIEKTKNNSGQDAYPFSYFEIDSVYFVIVKNFQTGESVKINYRELSTFRELLVAINNEGTFTALEIDGVSIDETNEAYMLKCESNLKHAERFFSESKYFQVPEENILSFSVTSANNFFNEVESFEDIKEEGDYYLNEEEGRVFSYDESSGNAKYFFAEFPYYLKKQLIKVSKCSESSFEEIIKTNVTEDLNTKRIKPNEKGSRFYNKLLNESSSYWGK